MRFSDNSTLVRKEPVFPTNKHYPGQKDSPAAHDAQDFARALTADVAHIPREIWMTFAFTLLVGTLLFGGGIYLVYNGTVNNVTDFVVLGSCGSLVGLCFTSVGSVILLKSVWRSRQERGLMHGKNKAHGLLISYFPDGQTRIVTLQRTDQLATRRQESVASAEASSNTTTAKIRKYRVSSKANDYNNFPPIPPVATPVCENAPKIQAPVQHGTTHLPASGTALGPKEHENDPVSLSHVDTQRRPVNTVHAYVNEPIIKKQTTVAKVRPLSFLSKRSIDSWKTYHESLTVVVAEVHPEPGNSRSSFRNSTSFRPRHLDFHESLLLTSPSFSDKEEGATCPLDYITGDASPPDTGVGESISEEDFLLVNDEPYVRYRMLTSDAENSDDDLMAAALDDPLIFDSGNGAEHSYMFNKCHVITEVLVHSG